MKKTLSIVLAVLMLSTFVACNNSVHTHKLEKVEANAATCLATGNTEYWKCTGCGKLFSDAEGVKETTLKDVTIPALSHELDDNGKCSLCNKYYLNDEAKLQAATSVEKANIVLTGDIKLVSQIRINANGVVLDGAGHTLTRNTPTTDEQIYEKSIIEVSKSTGVTIKNLNVSGTELGDNWNSGEFGIKLWESKDIVLEDVSVTKTNAGIQVSSTNAKVKGLITLSGNKFGGIAVDQSSTDTTTKGSLVIDEDATIVCTDNTCPAIWLESLAKAEISGEDGLTKLEKDGKVFYFTEDQDTSAFTN